MQSSISPPAIQAGDETFISLPKKQAAARKSPVGIHGTVDHVPGSTRGARAVTTPETRYAKSGEVRIAYQIIGHGPIDLVFVPGFISNLEVHWEDPGFSHLLRRLSAFTRLIQLDKRGTGLSDRVDTHHLPNLETRMDDVRAVMDAAGSQRAVLLGASEGGPMSILFAATYPERTRALVLYGSYAHFHTWVLPRDALEDFIGGIERAWGTGASVTRFAPELGKDERFRTWWGRYERQSCSPSAAIALARMNAAIDVRSVLPTIRVPTLIIHRSDDARVKFSGGRYLSEKIRGARFVELPGRDHPLWTGDSDRVIDEIEVFLTGSRPVPAHDRVLATILVARLAAPQRQAARLGDGRWSELLASFHERTADAIARSGGQRIATGGEEISARFDGPARAARCALVLIDIAEALGLQLAAGVHTGEIEISNTSIAGLAIHVAERVCARARAGEVLASGVVADLVAGSGLHFSERGLEAIDGLEAGLRVLAVTDGRGPAPPRPASVPTLELLSAREREVITFLADGLSNAAIAKRLSLSEHTVKRHVANILVKLDLPTRAAAAAVVGRRPA
jgi:pimeloyl-ACP methyl ester carboxylesterase/DNA-binding NarL/FixJ family response regulator